MDSHGILVFELLDHVSGRKVCCKKTVACCSRDFVSDFELMLQRKKEEMRNRRRKRKDVDLINDNDDLIAELIQRMRQAAEVCWLKLVRNFILDHS